MSLAPIALFVYNRPEHTRQTLESLAANDLSDESTLYIYCDGPKENAPADDLQRIKEVRKVVAERKWCKEVIITEYDDNITHPVNLVNRVTELLNRFGKIIVLEDDLVLGKGFLIYMNESLELYKDDQSVMQISGYMFPVFKKNLPETFFVRLYSNWGWATWKRAWDLFIHDAKFSISMIHDKKRFDIGDSIRNYRLLDRAAHGPWKYWDIRWYATIYIHNGLVLFPNRSLVRNIGHDSTGMHCGDHPFLKAQPIKDYIEVSRIPVVEHKKARQAIRRLHLFMYDYSFFSVNNFKKLFRFILPGKFYDKIKERKDKYLYERASK